MEGGRSYRKHLTLKHCINAGELAFYGLLNEEVKGVNHIFPNGTRTRNHFYDKDAWNLDDEMDEDTANLITR